MGKIGRPVGTKVTNLNFLFKAFPVGWMKWSDEKIHNLIIEIQNGNTDYDKLAKKFEVKPASVKNVVQELKRAANSGMTLESYLKKGRPLRTGKKVLA